MNKETADNFNLTPHGNYLLEIDSDYGCYVSYNPSLSLNLAGSPETAIIFGKGKQRYYILNGDYREYFSNCRNLNEAKQIALSLIEEPHAFWTNDWETLKDEPMPNPSQAEAIKQPEGVE